MLCNTMPKFIEGAYVDWGLELKGLDLGKDKVFIEVGEL